MGARGPAPKPPEVKLLEGNPGRRPINLNAPKPSPIAPSCPSWLGKEARKEWKRIAPELERLGLLTRVDMATLAGYCQSYSCWIAAEALLSTSPLVVESGGERYSTVKAHPAIAIAQKERMLMLQFAGKLGLSPSDRGRMTLPEVEGDDEDSPFEV